MSAVDILEFIAFLLIALGVGLALGSLNVAVGVGVGLALFGLCGLVWLIAYERGAS